MYTTYKQKGKWYFRVHVHTMEHLCYLCTLKLIGGRVFLLRSVRASTWTCSFLFLQDSDKLISALEVFVTNASLEDHQTRMSSLNHLLSLTHSIPWASVEIIAATEALAAVMKHPDIRSYVMEVKKKYGELVWCIIILVLYAVADVCHLSSEITT